jgi:hypothetical protein
MVVDFCPTLEQCRHISRLEKKYTLEICSPASVQFNSGVMLWGNSLTVTTSLDTGSKNDGNLRSMIS